MAIKGTIVDNGTLLLLCSFAEEEAKRSRRRSSDGAESGRCARCRASGVVQDAIRRIRCSINPPQEPAEETPIRPGSLRTIGDDYTSWKHRYADYTWEEMGEGSVGGGRHAVLKWLARRGRVSFDVDVKRDENGNIEVPYNVTLAAREVLHDSYNGDSV